MTDSGSSRRDFMKKAAYTAPLILTMNVSLAQARSGSEMPRKREKTDRPRVGKNDRPWVGKNDRPWQKRPVRSPVRRFILWLFG